MELLRIGIQMNVVNQERMQRLMWKNQLMCELVESQRINVFIQGLNECKGR